MKCRWYQHLIHRHVDDGRPLSTSTRAHLRSCERCETVLRTQTALVKRLSEEREPLADPSPFLAQRILNQIANEEREPRGLRPLWMGAAAVATVVVTLGTVLLQHSAQTNSAPTPVAVGLANASDQQWLEVTARMTSGGNLFRVATNLNQPLQNELELVIRDARKVVDKLTEEFVPPMLLASSE